MLRGRSAMRKLAGASLSLSDRAIQLAAGAALNVVGIRARISRD
jgi:hypothetical protein